MRVIREDASYQTLSDLGLATLGLLLFVIVSLLLVSELLGPEFTKKLDERISNKKAEIVSEKIHLKALESNNDTESIIKDLKKEYDQQVELKKKLFKNVEVELTKIGEIKENYDSAKRVIAEIHDIKKNNTNYTSELEKYKPLLESLTKYTTGKSVDRTGRAHLTFGSFTDNNLTKHKNERIVLIGEEGVLNEKEFLSLLNSFGHDGNNSFFIRFDTKSSKLKQDRSRPAWLNEIVYQKAKFKDLKDLKIKDDYSK